MVVSRQSEIGRCNSSLPKRKTLWIKQIIDQLVFYRQFRKSLKNLWKNNGTIIFRTIYLNIYVNTRKFKVLSKLCLCLLKVEKSLDDKAFGGAILMDMSKALKT